MAERIDQWAWWMADVIPDERIDEVEDLMPQLTDHPFESITKDRIKEVMNGGWSVIATIHEDGKVCAMAELHVFTTLLERKGQIDNVVADEKYRGRGFGEKIMKTLLDRAFVVDRRPLDLVQLTSNPDNPKRYAARKLYEKLGFREKYKGLFVITRDEWLAKRGEFGNRD